MHRAYILAENEIGVDHLPPEVVAGATVPAAVSPNGSAAEMGATLRIRVGSRAVDVEQQLIMATLDACGGNKQKAAEILGVSLKTLYNRLAAYKEADKRES